MKTLSTPTSHWPRPLRGGVVAALFIAYFITFPILYEASGAGGAAVSSIIVVLAAWLLGMWAGFFAGLILIPMHTFLLNMYIEPGWDVLLRVGGFPGAIAMVLTGGGLGWIRDLYYRTQMQAEARRQAEEDNIQLALENAVLAEIGRVISSSLNVNQVYERFAQEVKRIVKFDLITINIADYDKGTLTGAYTSGVDIPSRRRGESYPLENTWSGEIIRRDAGMLIQGKELRDLIERFPRVAPIINAGSKSLVGAPLRSEDRIIAVLNLASFEENAYSERDKEFIERVGTQIAGTIANAKLHEELQREADEREIIAEIGRVVGSSLNMDEVYDHFAEHVRRLIPFERIVVALIDYQRQTVTHTYIWGESVPDRIRGLTLPLEGTFSGVVAKKRAGVLVQSDDISEYENEIPTLLPLFQSGFRSYITVPLISNDVVIGVIHMISKRVDAYTQRDLTLAESVGAQIAGAIANSRLYTEREQLQEQLLHSQKMEAVGKLAGGIAHDFNNLLTPILDYSQMALNAQEVSDTTRKHIQEIHNAGTRASDLVRQMLAFSRQEIVEPKVFSLSDMVTRMSDMIRRLIGEDVELHINVASDLWTVKMDSSQMEQVLMNLVVNARDAMPNGGNLTIETCNLTITHEDGQKYPELILGEYVQLSVKDDGVGISEELMPRIFEPFFTTKEVGKGTGLGLSTCYGIVTQNAGSIAVESSPDVGTEFRVLLPRSDEHAKPTHVEESGMSDMKSFETVLLVEDESLVREVATTILRQQGYEVLDVGSGKDALQVANDMDGQPIHLLLTDIVMPEMNGKELAERLLQSHPESKVLFTSGYTDDIALKREVSQSGVAFLQKPFTPDTLTQRVRSILDGD